MVLVTGASGLVGCALVKQLLEKKEKIRVFLLSEKHKEILERLIKDENLSPADIEYVYGDVRDKESLKPAFEGIKELYHLAVFISVMPGDYKKLYETNVKGLENVLETAIEAKIEKVIYVSSVEAIGFKKEETMITEEIGFRPDHVVIEYGETKALASLKALEMAKEAKLPLVIVAPSGIIGPYDYLSSSFTGKAIRLMGKKKLPAHVGGAFDFVDSRDVARMCYLAMKTAPAYELYLCTGNYIELAGILDIIAEKMKIKSPVEIPAFLAKTLAVLFEHLYKFFGINLLLSRGSYRLTHYYIPYDNSKAKKALNWEPRPIKETVLETLDWYLKNS